MESKLRETTSKQSYSKRKSDTLDYGVVFPISLQFSVVAKFLCNRGLADRVFCFDDPSRPCQLTLVREPTNKYDPRAILIKASQLDGHTLQPTTQTQVTDGREATSTAADDVIELTLGYVPKDIAYSLSQIVDNTHVFDILSVNYFQAKNQLSVKFGLHPNVLRDQRIGQANTGLYYIRRFPHMPHNLRSCLYSLNTLNENKKSWLEAKEVLMNSDQIEFEVQSQPTISEGIDLESNKYNRNVLLVLDCVIHGMQGLFSASEIKIHQAYKELDSLAQTVFARMITRKRVWYIVDEHLQTYAPEITDTNERDLEQLQVAVTKLTQCGLLETEKSIFDPLLERALADKSGEDFTEMTLEPLAALLESLTMQQLNDLSKLAGKAIRKVKIDKPLIVQEVTSNPLYSLNQYLNASTDLQGEPSNLLQQLDRLSHKLSKTFSHHFVAHMTKHEKQYKRDLNRRAIIHKILSRVQGLLDFDESHYTDDDQKPDKQQSTLLSFFKFKQTQTQSVSQPSTFEQRMHRRATKSFDELSIGLRAILSPKSAMDRVVLVKMNARAKALVTRCANLFFFYQLGDEDAFKRLQLHDYGFYQYQKFENYLMHQEERQKKAVDSLRQSFSDILQNEHPYLKPLFRTRSDLLVYDCLLYIRLTTLPWLTELKLKDCSHLLGYVGAKLTKLFLKHFCNEDTLVLQKTDEHFISKSNFLIRQKLFQAVEMLTEASHFDIFQQSQGVLRFADGTITYGTRKSDLDNKTVHFGRKYGQSHMLAGVLGKLAEVCLEKDKQYELSCLVYARLLLGRQVKTHKRGDWWVRLCVDLKHLRLRKDCLKIITVSLFDAQWVKTGPRNQLLKMKQQLEKTLKPISKPTKPKPKPKPKKRKKKSKEQEEPEKQPEEVYDIEQLEKDLLEALEPIEDQKSVESQQDEAPIKENFKKVCLSCIRVESAPPRMVLDASGNYVPDRVIQQAMYFDPKNNEYFDVENLALRYYSTHEKLNGMHCENSLGKQFFGLLMWHEVFYDKVPFVFQSPFQAVPLDFGTKDFYLQRAEIIDGRLEQIAKMTSEQLADEINTMYLSHRNKYNALVNWDSTRLTLKRLVEIGSILGGRRLSKILENYCRDYKSWGHGMPDLILWSQNQSTRESKKKITQPPKIVKFSEVKSESDRLSEVQIAWLNFFTENDISAEVCLINRIEEGCQLIEIFPN